MEKTKTVKLKVVETSDVHGNFYPYDFINRKPKGGSFARVFTYIEELRKQYGKNVILLDNGDILQGQPTCYCNNFIDTKAPHIAALMLNYMGYDACNLGNHDIETGHAVYDRWTSEIKSDVLGANIIDTETNKPYFKPYAIIERDGVKIAVIGMITAAIPSWLNESLWSGLRFESMVECARKWVKTVKEKEHAQVIIGLLHSGKEGGIVTEEYKENESIDVAKEVPGFDIIFYGHDHARHCDRIQNSEGKDVLCIDPSTEAYVVGDVTITLTIEGDRITERQIDGELHNVNDKTPSEVFLNEFKKQYDSVCKFVNRRIGYFENTIRTRDSYFGNSAFTDFIHFLQRKITGAQISFAAPLSFDATIEKGDIHVGDAFNLYRYENQIYVMKLTGKEIREYLEMSYNLWVNTMKSSDDHIMLLSDMKFGRQKKGFKNLVFNFDSASGIDYTVDVTKPNGQKVTILRMSDGKPFIEDNVYTVVEHSYRGNGGGELLTLGAGIPRESLASRITYKSEKDLRYYLMKYIEEKGTLNLQPDHNWKFIPESWTKVAIERDRKLIYGNF